LTLLIRADLHIHSTYSDGKASPVEILSTAREKGILVVSITDHDTFAGSVYAKRYTASTGVLVVPGVEVRTDQGDILVYCSGEIDFPRRLDSLMEKAHGENCLVVPAHPFDLLRLGIGDLVYEYKDWDAIEVWNSSSTKKANYKAMEAAKILNKPGLSNSDAHIVDEVGVAFNVLDVGELSIESTLEAIRKGRTRPVYGKAPFRARINRMLWSIEKTIRR